ncbi:hypothetical protein OC846_005658 [Tilletia horrida]|uniref:SAM domain-containing protein n=1 Tax=Tilletia horrida TaxID=155126 RepID=A0AAN6GKC0_9BASI|nr:hypothetical protein OC845_005827 [Tilletia horrida]KAK0545448.1 hypothetical protein OC846_005658 [Tilletia horrida]KAK0561450.1 hypothetical protein OC861_005802 [Tilletia horrida]
MPAVRVDMIHPQREGFTRSIIRDLDIWSYTLPLQEGETEYGPPMTRRADTNYINATRLLSLSNLSPSQRARELSVMPTSVIRGGLNSIQGTWSALYILDMISTHMKPQTDINFQSSSPPSLDTSSLTLLRVPLVRARELAKTLGLFELIKPILFDPSDPPTNFVDERGAGSQGGSSAVIMSVPRGPKLSAAAKAHLAAARKSEPGRITATIKNPRKLASRQSLPGPSTPPISVGADPLRTGSSTLSLSGGPGGPSLPVPRAKRSATDVSGSASAGPSKRRIVLSGASLDGPKVSASSSGSNAGGQQIKIASWTSFSRGSDNDSSSRWDDGSLAPPVVGSSSSESGSSSPAGSADTKPTLTFGERHRVRVPTLAELNSILQSEAPPPKRSGSGSSTLRMAAATNLARSSLRGLSGSSHTSGSDLHSSGLPPLSSNGASHRVPSSSTALVALQSGSTPAASIPAGSNVPFPVLSRVNSASLVSSNGSGRSNGSSSGDHPSTWNSNEVVEFGRTRAWHESRVLLRLREADIDGQLLLSLDFDDRSVFMLNQCGISVPGDQIRIIQGAEHLRKQYAARR